MTDLMGMILNMSLTGSAMVVLVIILRALMRKFPKKYSYGLWAVAAFKLLCPVSFGPLLKSLFSHPVTHETVTYKAPVKAAEVIPSYTPEVHDMAVKNAASGSEMITETAKNLTISSDTANILLAVWIIGAVIFLSLIIIKTIKLYKDLRGAVPLGNNIYGSSKVSSPFVFGILRPRIYIPLGLKKDEYMLLIKHEMTHIRRKDLLLKTLGIVILAIHWFNPIVWIAFRLFERDMEMSCDEEVIGSFERSERADYCRTLVNHARSGNRPKYSVIPINFGKKDVKARIDNIMKYRKLSKAASAAVILAFGLAVAGCLAAPESEAIEIKETPAATTTTQTSETSASETTIETTAETTTETTAPSDETEPTTVETEPDTVSVQVDPEGDGAEVLVNYDENNDLLKNIDDGNNTNQPYEGPNQSIADLAESLIGVPYVFAGDSRKGLDNMGLITYVYGEIGISIPRNAQEASNSGIEVDRDDLKAGDVVFYTCYDDSGEGFIGHEGIYVGDGNIVHTTVESGVEKTSIDILEIATIRRFIAA